IAKHFMEFTSFSPLPPSGGEGRVRGDLDGRRSHPSPGVVPSPAGGAGLRARQPGQAGTPAPPKPRHYGGGRGDLLASVWYVDIVEISRGYSLTLRWCKDFFRKSETTLYA